MDGYLSDDATGVLELAAASPGPLLEELAEHGRETGFPTIGPIAGRTLGLLATVAGAERVFEFGSGFGYSAAWFAEAVGPAGEVVLTEEDPAELEEAREFLGRIEDAPRFRFELGDAMETFGTLEGPWDVVLIDHDKTRYADAYDLARPAMSEGGVVVADNVLAGPVEPGNVRAALAGEPAVDEMTRGIAEYVERVRDDPDAETAVLPVGQGLAVTSVGG